MMRQEVVQRRQWVDEQHFLDLLGATNLIPGPNSTEMAIHLGYLRAGWRGLIVAGLCFIVPAMLIVMALAALYVRYGTAPAAGWLLAGITPVVIAIIAQAAWELGRKAVKGPLTAVVGLAALLLALGGFNEIALIFAGGLVVMVSDNARRLRGVAAGFALLPFGGEPGPTAAWSAATWFPRSHWLPGSTWLPPSHWLPGSTWTASATWLLLAATAAPFSLWQLFLSCLKIGAVLYGSGYVLVALLQAEFVERLGWLTQQQLVDAITIGQITPGPLFTSATFIGYLLAGAPGAVVATVGIFLTSFVFVAASNPVIPRLRRSPWFGPLLDGVNVASLGLIIAVTLELARTFLADPVGLAVALVAAVLLFRFGVGATWLVLLGALVGLAQHLMSL
jgi:chromate transporter